MMASTFNIIMFTSRNGGVRSYAINPRYTTLLALTGIALLWAVLLYGGYRVGVYAESERQLVEVTRLQTLNRRQQMDITRTRETARDTLDALTLRLGRLQAEMLRLDALGTLLVAQADLDPGEFDFSLPPPVGGPQTGATEPPTAFADFMDMLDELDATARDRADKLVTLDRLLMYRDLKTRTLPSGRAVEHGLLSSKFGPRIDPFTGKRAQHKGIDIAGKEGSNILAVGDGVVIWSGKRSGFGNLVEIDHGDGYITRYGHNSKTLVNNGDKVSKGQVIALMGSTGRSTGPHVHIEVLHHGKPVDPAGYLASH